MKIFAKSALLPEGWRTNVLIEIRDGAIAAVMPDTEAESAEIVAGALIPGMSNVHSHAFQRAMAGLTERAGTTGDNFWSWREIMYKFLARISPEDNEAIATELYIEMLKAGYTSVAEFHYLHHDIDGKPYQDVAEMAIRIAAAANTAGIGLTMLPVFYAHSNFGGLAPNDGQKRFIHSTDSFATLLDQLMPLKHQGGVRQIGIAPHSLRAVTPEELRAIIAMLDGHDKNAPIHIHAAEQRKEVDDCLAWSHKRPVAWLLDNHDINARWCLVHATQLNDDETYRLAKSRAIAGLCPSTEANLGDGIFNAPDYFLESGCWGIGGDSHVGVDPFRELAIIEYAQRLKSARRNILATPGAESIGGGLYRQALQGGAAALGQKVGAIKVGAIKVGAIAPGYRADLLVLNEDDPALCEHSGDGLLDAAIFGPTRAAVRDVMVNGVWVVRDGHHKAEEVALLHYRQTLKKLLH